MFPQLLTAACQGQKLEYDLSEAPDIDGKIVLLARHYLWCNLNILRVEALSDLHLVFSKAHGKVKASNLDLQFRLLRTILFSFIFLFSHNNVLHADISVHYALISELSDDFSYHFSQNGDFSNTYTSLGLYTSDVLR